jgi:hypothetical protein
MSSVRALRPMGLLEIVDQTFRLYRANFLLLFSIVAVACLPIMVLFAVPGLSLVAIILIVPVILVVYGALTKAISELYLGKSIRLADSYGFAARRLFPFLFTALFTYLFVISPTVVTTMVIPMVATAGRGGFANGASFVILMIVGVVCEFVFAFWCSFVPQVFVVEDKRYAKAIGRSKFLVGRGTWAEVFVIGVVMNLIMLAIFYAILIPVALLSGGFGAGSGGDEFGIFSGVASPVAAIGLVLFGLAISVVTPMQLISFVLLYYDSRIRKEGFDLQMLAQELGAQLPPPAEAPAQELPAPEPLAAPTPPDEGSV